MAKFVYFVLISLTYLFYRPLRNGVALVRNAYAYRNVDEFEKNPTKRRLAWISQISFLTLLTFMIGISTVHYFNNEFIAGRWLLENYRGITIRYEQMRDNAGLIYLPRELIKKAVTELPAAFSDQTTPKMNINIDFKSYEILRKERTAAIQRGIRTADENQYVPATIDFQGKNIKAKLRLKGDLDDHWSDEKKWSFKIKVKNDTFMGMSVFSIQAPWTRNYQVEPLYFKTLREIDILTPRYKFVEASINGENIGIMAIEESFSKNLLESQERKDGPILKIFEDYRWQADRVHAQEVARGLKDKVGGKMAAFESMNAFVFEEMSSPDPKLTSLAISLMRSVIEGKLRPSDVLDVDLWSKYLANAIVWGAPHDTVWTNLRLYYNPITARIEPIAYDANLMDMVEMRDLMAGYFPQSLDRLFFSDPLIMKSVKKNIKVLANLYTSDEYIDQIKDTERQYLRSLRKEFRLLPSFNYSSLSILSAKRSKEVLEDHYFLPSSFSHDTPVDYSDQLKLPTLALVFLSRDEKHQQLDIRNLIEDSITINNITVTKNNINIPYSNVLNVKLPLTFEKTSPFETAKTFSYPIKNVGVNDTLKITLHATTPLHPFTYDIAAIDYPVAATQPVLVPIPVNDVLKRYPEFSYDRHKNVLSLKNTKLRVKDFIILPEGTRLEFHNTTLSYTKEAGLFVQGAVDLKNVTMEPENKGDHWRGFIVMSANKNTPGIRSRLEDVAFIATDFPKHGDWTITGGVTFNQSDLDIKGAKIIDPISEDGINIIRSNFTMDHMELSGSRSDGFDGDFAVGSITNSRFDNTGGDGIDFSGSKITVRNCTFDGNHDKAVSMGEDSHADVADISITNAATGLAAKDLSSILAKNVKLRNITHASLMAYQKKPEYGGGKIVATDIDYEQSEKAIIAQKGSAVTLNERVITPIKIDIDALYKEGYMKK